MVTISKIRSIAYYTGLAAEDYYLKGGEPPGIWAGFGASELGLIGEVSADDLQKLMHGFDQRGNPLCDNAGSENHVPGNDICFSPGKSTSIAWARSPEKLRVQILSAHNRSVKFAIRHLERYAAVTRRGHDGIERENVAGTVCALFQHSTSREIDPQLHTHVLVLNVAQRHDGSWGTLESRDLFLWLRSCDAVYKAALATNLREIGFRLEVDEGCTSFEIAGIPDDICQHFSKRGQQIKMELDARGIKTGSTKASDMVALSTRKPKITVDRADLARNWTNQMDSMGFSELDLINAMEPELPSPSWLDECPDPPLDYAALREELTETTAIFEQRHVYQRAAEIAIGTHESLKTVEHVADQLIYDSDTIYLGQDFRGSRIYTSTYQLDAERKLVATAKELRNLSGFSLREEIRVKMALNRLPHPPSEEQEEAILAACGHHRFAIVQGSAGTGKTTIMLGVKHIYENDGFEVIGAALSKAAADNLGQEARIRASTIDKLLISLDRGKSVLNTKTVLIVDEAGQVGSRKLGILAEYVKNAGSKLILTGDERQLDAIEHGGMLRYLSRPEVLGTSRIETIRRQRQPWARQAVADLRDGLAEKALHALDERGLINFYQDQESACSALVSQLAEFKRDEPEKSFLVLAQRWKDVERISNQIREMRKLDGQLDPHSVSLRCVVGKHEQKLEFSVGDRVRCTYNNYRIGLTNGVLGELVGMEELADGDTRLVVKEDTGSVKTFLCSEYCDYAGRLQMVHAYATTVYSSQGLTVDESFVLHDHQMDRASAYVAGSRHRDNSRWFFNTAALDDLILSSDKNDRLTYLAKSLSTDRYQNTAIEVFERRRLGRSAVQSKTAEPAL